QLILDCAQHRLHVSIRHRAERDTDEAIELVDVADRLGARMVLCDARSVGEPGVPGIPGACVDFVELDQGAEDQRPDEPAMNSRRMTMTIATPWNSTRRCIHFCDCSPVRSRPEAMFTTPRTRT